MATKKAQGKVLAKPSEFSCKGNSSTPFLSELSVPPKSKCLMPPSRYAAKKGYSKAKGGHKHQSFHTKFDQDCSEKYNAFLYKPILGNQSDPFKGKKELPSRSDEKHLEDTTKRLMVEIKSCKEENRKMLEDLKAQLRPLMEGKEDIKRNLPMQHKQLQEVMLQVQQNHDRNFQFQELLQGKIQKQSDTIERMTQQFLEHQSDLTTENEKLARKMSRLIEEHRDVKIHLEKQIEMKESQCHNYVLKLQQLEYEMTEVIVKNRKEIHELQKELKDKEIALVSLESVKDAREKVIEQMKSSKDEAVKSIEMASNYQLASLQETLAKYEKDLKMEKEEKVKIEKTLLAKEKTFKSELKANNDKLMMLQETLECKENELKSLGRELKVEKEKNVQQNHELTSKLQSKLSSCQDEFRRSNLEQEKLMADIKKNSDDLKGKLDETSRELENARAKVKELNAYITDKELETDSKNLMAKLNVIENENTRLKETCSSLESAVKFLNIRVSSLTNMIQIQESEYSRSGLNHVDENASKLLSKWREKVYSLLVQLKSHNISENEEMTKLENQLKDYQRQSKDHSSRIEFLENQLIEKNADIELKSNELKAHANEITVLKQELNRKDEKETKSKESYMDIESCIAAFKEAYNRKCDKIEKSLTLLRSLESRVKFANKRLQMVQDLFNRKEALWRSKLNQVQAKSQGESEYEGKKVEELSAHDSQSLLSEVEHLTKERESLMSQIKSDTEKLTSLEESLRIEYEGKMKTRDDVIEQMRTELESRKIVNDEMSAKIVALENEHRELMDENEKLKFDAKRWKTELERDLDSKLEEEREAHIEECSKLERVINEMKREHTKAVISSQQLERQMNWQKQNCKDLLKERDEEHMHEISKLKQKAQELEKERNVLLTTIKQENIKIPRPKHVDFGAAFEEEAVATGKFAKKKTRKHSKDEGKRRNEKPSGQESKKLSEMLKELQSISATLLQDENTTKRTGLTQQELV